MKGLILKDLYNIGHNAKYMMFVMIMIAIMNISTSDIGGFSLISAILCSIMIINTFAFDDNCKWTGYALAMPVSRKELVRSKFIVLVVFCIIGCVLGLVIDLVGGLIMKRFNSDICQLFFFALGAFGISLILGSILIPLALKFGAEKARILMAAVVIVPTMMISGIIIIGLFTNPGMGLMELTEQNILILMCGLVVFAFLWCYVMYLISCNIINRQEY